MGGAGAITVNGREKEPLDRSYDEKTPGERRHDGCGMHGSWGSISRPPSDKLDRQLISFRNSVPLYLRTPDYFFCRISNLVERKKRNKNITRPFLYNYLSNCNVTVLQGK